MGGGGILKLDAEINMYLMQGEFFNSDASSQRFKIFYFQKLHIFMHFVFVKMLYSDINQTENFA